MNIDSCSPPPIPSEPDREYQARLDAERVTAEFKTKSTRHIDAGKLPIEESPLFGGRAQGELF